MMMMLILNVQAMKVLQAIPSQFMERVVNGMVKLQGKHLMVSVISASNLILLVAQHP
jgi:hypothetical protein